MNRSDTYVRPAAVAGMFYPHSATALSADVRSYLAAARSPDLGRPTPKALIVPHAGYIYSGPVAATAYVRLLPAHSTIRRVVLLGPARRVALRGIALPDASAFSTPLGAIDIDQDAAATLRRQSGIGISGAAHAEEHALEVQVPFLQSVLDRFTLVPLVVGYASGDEVAAVLDLLWGGDETVIIVSSDLSHYHRYADAQSIDRATADTILNEASTLDHEQACGATPINGLLTVARRRALRVELCDLRNSGDTAGDRSRVVGYGAFAFYGDASARH